MITGSQARSMAKARWGSGPHGYRTNRKGAFYYSCSGHGGYVVDGRSLSEAERTSITPFIQPDFATEVVRHLTQVVTAFRGPDSNRNLRYYSQSQFLREVPIYFFEEDCAWSVLEKFTDIRCRNTAETDPDTTFWRWYDPTNPVVQERHRQDAARASHSPDLIVWATPTHVGTADGLQHPIPENYDRNHPWLS